MKVTIRPGKAKGCIQAPPSKSMAHRMLIGAGLATGTSVVRNIELSEDIKATLGILEAFGATYTFEQGVITIKGIGNQELIASRVLDCRESGSTLRFFIPLALLGEKKTLFTGSERLMERPLDIYDKICEEQRLMFEKKGNTLCVRGELKSGLYLIAGNISSQFITGLLYALPLLPGDSALEILPPIESRAYIDMTVQILKTFCVQIEKHSNRYEIAGNQRYQARDVFVEGDYSNAAFLDALNLFGGEVEVTGLTEDTLQGDAIYRTYFEKLQEEMPTLDISGCPDLGPILMGMGAALHGVHLTGTRRLKIKESDRGAVMARELEKFGIETEVFENEIIVKKGILQCPTEDLYAHNDHRIAMSLATLCTITGGTIDGAECVKKSFPSYFDAIENLGIALRRE